MSAATASPTVVPEGHANYKGLPIQAHEAVHQIVADLVQRHFSLDSRILDIAAGYGALTLRLMDAGFRPRCTSWNMKVAVPGVEPFRLNLDQPFGTTDVGGNAYDCVLCVEIVEHVENPAQFLRSVSGILSPRGMAILTTPNVESAYSRFQVLVRGYPNSFDDSEVSENRHIWPPYHTILDRLIAHAGLAIADRIFAPAETPPATPRGLLKRAVLRASSAIMRGDFRGASRIYVLRKAGESR